MAIDTSGTIVRFLKEQVLRSDYLVIDEPMAYRTRFAHEQKLERLHTLCIRHHFRKAVDCERIRRTLYTRDNNNSACPAQLLLGSAYLPECVLSLPANARDLSSLTAHTETRLKQRCPYGSHDNRLSTLNWEERMYVFYFPAPIHSLLIEGDAALFAA